MNKLINNIKSVYDKGENIISYLKSQDGRKENSLEDIMISYDLQAGTYLDMYYKNEKGNNPRVEKRAKIISEYLEKDFKIMEAGVGEATNMVPILKRILNSPKDCSKIYGFDISWSRIKYAEKLITEEIPEYPIELFVGDLKNMPLKDNSIDLIYTIHAIEPNGGAEEEILKELYRVTSKYLILFEPAYELADEESRRRMVEHGYVTRLYETALRLGYEVKKYELLENNINLKNPTGVMIIEKKGQRMIEGEPLCDPISKSDIKMTSTEAWCEETMLVYPILKGIPMLTAEHGIFATKWEEF